MHTVKKVESVQKIDDEDLERYALSLHTAKILSSWDRKSRSNLVTLIFFGIRVGNTNAFQCEGLRARPGDFNGVANLL